MQSRIYTVGQVNGYLKSLMDQDPLLSNLCMRGEISNYKLYPSGHHYFSMKDADGAMRCVLFRGNATRLRFRPENGMQVLVTGRVAVYPRDGKYQFYVTSMTPDGVGDLHVAFEQLKQKLSSEGLFDEQHKKPIPAYPKRIAIVTSPVGAAVRDMLRILGARYPLSKVMILPVRVQGEEAPAEIAAAIRYANRFSVADVLITGRGGGSIEDLWAFNEEHVARAIYDSQIPVISAVGHEPDVTIADYVADLRAATPSNAAELVVPDQQELQLRLDAMQNQLAAAMKRRLRASREQLQFYTQRHALQSPAHYVKNRKAMLDANAQRLTAAASRVLSGKKQAYVRLCAMLDSMSPLKVLARGYAIATTPAGVVMSTVRAAQQGDTVEVQFVDGRLTTTVESVTEEAI